MSESTQRMTPRDRVRAVIHFRKPDALPWIEMYSLETILKWFTQGLPADEITVVEETNWHGAILPTRRFAGFDPHRYFGTLPPEGLPLPIDSGPIPKFKFTVLRQHADYLDYMNPIGQIARKRIKGKYTLYNMPMFLDFPVKDSVSWERYKERLNPNDPRRYPKDWGKDQYLEAFEKYAEGHTSVVLAGFYGFGGQLMGIVNFMLMFYKNPELIEDMADYWEYFTIETMRDAVETLKDRLDLVFWWEDFAERHGPNISPKLYREFLLPHYKRVTSFLAKNKIDRILMDSDGNTNAMLDLVVDAGITGHWPLEVNSGMDAVHLRKKYGTRLFLVGNLDKIKVEEGGEAMREEVESKLPVLKEMGGYIPGLDHSAHPEITLQNFRQYSEYVKRYLQY
jgi:hypothetical protein